MAEINKIIPSMQRDMAKFKERLANLTPLLDQFASSSNTLALQVEDLVVAGKVEAEILPHVNEAVALQEVQVEQLYARVQDAIGRILEATAHLQEADYALQNIAARREVFERLINREEGKTE